jgi:hypothetical protein
LPDDFKNPFVWAHKDTGAFVKALVEECPPGTNLRAISETLTWPEYTKVWAETLGVKAVYKNVGLEEHFGDKALPAALREEIMDAFAYAIEYNYDGGDPSLKTAEQVSSDARNREECTDWSAP